MIIQDVALAFSIGTALIAVRHWYKGKAMTNKKTRLTVHLDAGEYAAFQQWAERCGQTVTECAKAAIVAAVPAGEWSKHTAAEAEAAALDAAFEALDASDTGGGDAGIPGILPLPPGRRPQVGVKTEAERTHPQERVIRNGKMELPVVPPGPHPCWHLSPPPPNLRGVAQGICGHSNQEGRPCYFPPTTASHCRLFESPNDFRRRR